MLTALKGCLEYCEMILCIGSLCAWGAGRIRTWLERQCVRMCRGQTALLLITIHKRHEKQGAKLHEKPAAHAMLRWEAV